MERSVSSEMCLANLGLFIRNNSPSARLEWLHLNVTAVLIPLPFGGCGDAARPLLFYPGRIKPGCLDLAAVRGAAPVLVLRAGPGLRLLTQRVAGRGRRCLPPTHSWSKG